MFLTIVYLHSRHANALPLLERERHSKTVATDWAVASAGLMRRHVLRGVAVLASARESVFDSSSAFAFLVENKQLEVGSLQP